MNTIARVAALVCVLCSCALAHGSATAAGPALPGAGQAHASATPAVRERLAAYVKSYTLARKIREASRGRIAFGLRVMPATAGASLDELQLWLGEGEQATPVALGEGGLFAVPINDQIAASNAYYWINRKKSELKVSVALLPTVARDAWTIGLMQQVILDGRAAVKSALPWYMRALGLGVQAVGVCSPEAGMPVRVMNGNEVAATFSADTKATDDIDHPVFCKQFTADEKLDAGYKVVIPEGAQVLLL